MDDAELRRIFDDPVSQDLLHSPALARMAYLGKDGGPRVVPVGYLWDGTAFIVCTATNAPKVKALTDRPAVALTVDTETFPPHVLLVRGTASVDIVDGVPDEFLAASAKAVPEDQLVDFEAQARSTYPAMARIRIAPRWAKVLDFETRLPKAVEHLAFGETDV